MGRTVCIGQKLQSLVQNGRFSKKRKVKFYNFFLNKGHFWYQFAVFYCSRKVFRDSQKFIGFVPTWVGLQKILFFTLVLTVLFNIRFTLLILNFAMATFYDYSFCCKHV